MQRRPTLSVPYSPQGILGGYPTRASGVSRGVSRGVSGRLCRVPLSSRSSVSSVPCVPSLPRSENGEVERFHSRIINKPITPLLKPVCVRVSPPPQTLDLKSITSEPNVDYLEKASCSITFWKTNIVKYGILSGEVLVKRILENAFAFVF